MGSAQKLVEHRIVEPRSTLSGCLPSKLALHSAEPFSQQHKDHTDTKSAAGTYIAQADSLQLRHPLAGQFEAVGAACSAYRAWLRELKGSLISIREDSGTIRGLKDRLCGAIGVNSAPGTLGAIMGPPAVRS